MSVEVRISPSGLTTNLSQLIGAESGLVRAENVICRRPGIITPRGGYQAFGASSLPADHDYCTMVAEYDGVRYQIASDPDNETSILMREADGAAGQPMNFEDRYPSSATVGASLAVACDQGIRMVDDSSESAATFAARMMGVPRPVSLFGFLITSATASQNWLATNYATGYRAVLVRYIDGRPFYGPPSDMRIVMNNAGADRAVRIRVNTVDAWMEGLEVQIYRSSAAITPYTAIPSDEMRLRYSVVVTATDVANGFISFADYLDDAEWSGPSLYTNASQQGLDQSNYAPGLASSIASYNGMTFLGAARTAPQVLLNLKSVGDVPEPQESLVSVKFGGNTTTGSATITGVTAAAFPYIAQGQVVTLASNTSPGTADATFLATATIGSFNAGAGTITLTSNAQTTGAVTAIAWDWVAAVAGSDSVVAYAGWVDKVGATTFSLLSYVPGGTGVNLTRTNGVFAVADEPTLGYMGGSQDIERAFGALELLAPSNVRARCYSAFTDPTSTKRGISLLFTIDQPWDDLGDYGVGSVGFNFLSTKPKAFGRDFSVTSGGIGAESSGGTNTIAISKSLEPEAFPPANTVKLGTDHNQVVSVIGTTDSLWARTTEGLWRIYGDDPSNLIVQPYDTTARSWSTAPSWATRYGDTVYAWTQRGIVAITAGGVTNVDGQIRDIVRKFSPRLDTLDIGRAWCGASIQDQIVVIGAREVDAANGATICLCYCPETAAWTTWAPYLGSDDTNKPFRLWSMATSSDGTMLVGFGANYAEGYYWELPAYELTTYPPHYDTIGGGDYTLPTATVTGTTVALTTATTDIRVDTGDYIEFPNSQRRYVTSGSGSSVVVESGGGDNGQLVTVRKAFPVRVTYAATMGGIPLAVKWHREVNIVMSMLRYGRSFTLDFQSLDGVTSDSQTVTYDTSTGTYEATVQRPFQRRIAVPRDQSQGWGLAVTFSALQACQSFELIALCLAYDLQSEWVNRD